MITSLINTNLCCIMGSLKTGKVTIIETSFKKDKIRKKGQNSGEKSKMPYKMSTSW